MINKYYLYYDDDYFDSGGVGFFEFDNIEEVEKFIEGRMKSDNKREKDNYTVIYGNKLSIEIIKVVDKISIS